MTKSYLFILGERCARCFVISRPVTREWRNGVPFCAECIADVELDEAEEWHDTFGPDTIGGLRV